MIERKAGGDREKGGGVIQRKWESDREKGGGCDTEKGGE